MAHDRTPSFSTKIENQSNLEGLTTASDLPLTTTSTAAPADIETHSFSYQGMNPTVIAVREVQETRQTELNYASHTFSSHFNESLSASNTNHFEQHDAEELPHFQGKKGKFDEGILSRLFPYGVLETILKLSSDKKKCLQITLKDVQDVLGYCNYTGNLPYCDVDDLNFLCFSIFANLAEKGWHFPNEVIQVLLDELSKLKETTCPYALFAISHLILNGQCSQVKSEVLISGMEKLISLGKTNYFETIILALSAKSKLGDILSDQDLVLIELALNDLYIQNNSLYQRSINKTNPENDGITDREWYSTIRKYSDIKLMIAHLKNGHLLSAYRLNYTISRWEKLDEYLERLGLIKLVNLIIEKGQRNFKDKEKLEEILKSALSETDMMMRQLSITSAHHLLLNEEVCDRQGFVTELEIGLTRQRQNALRALYHFINQRGTNVISNKEHWIKILEKCKKIKEEEINDLLRYLISRLKNNINELEKVVLNHEHCQQVVNMIFLSAKYGEKLSNEMIEPLEYLVLNSHFPKSNMRIPGSIKLKVLYAFEYIAINGQVLSEKMIAFLIKNKVDEIPKEMVSSSLKILSYSIDHHKEYIRKHLISMLMEILVNYHDSELIQNTLFAISKLIESSDDLPKGCSTILGFLEIPLLKLMSEKLDPQHHKSIILVFGKAIQNKYILREYLIYDFFKNIILFSDNLDYRLKILYVVGMSLEYHVKENKKIKDSADFYSVLLPCFYSESEQEVCDAAAVLELYFKMVETNPKDEFVINISACLAQKQQTLTLCQILQTLVGRDYYVPELVMTCLIANFDKKSGEEIFRILSVLKNISEKQSVTSDILQILLISVPVRDQENIELVIDIFKNEITINNKIHLDQVSTIHLKLIDMVCSLCFDDQIRMKVLAILENLSKQKNIVFSMAFFNQLERFINEETPEIYFQVLTIIKNQLPVLQKYLFNENSVLTKLFSQILQNLENKKIKLVALQVLVEAKRQGYPIAKVLIEVDALFAGGGRYLTQLGEMFYTEKSQAVRDALLELIQVGVEKFDSKILKDNYALERQIKDFNQAEHPADIRKSLNVLIRVVRVGQRPTMGVFHFLEKMILENKTEFTKILCELCLSIQAHFMLPEFLIKAIVSITLNHQKSLYFQDLCHVLSLHVIQKNSINFEICQVLDQFVKLNQGTSDLRCVVLDALSIAIHCAYNISDQAIAQLMAWAMLDNENLALTSIELLNQIFKEKKQGDYIGFLPIDDLLKYCSQSENKKLISEVERLILKLSQLIKFDSHANNELAKLLTNGTFSLDPQLIYFISDPVNIKNDLTEKHKAAIEFKKLEIEFLSEQTLLERKLSILEKNLFKLPNILANETWIQIKQWIVSDLTFDKKIRVLSFLVNILDKTNIPEPLLLAVIDLLDHDRYAKSMTLETLFKKMMQIHFPVTPASFKKLCKKMLETQNADVRVLAYSFLKHFSKQLPEEIKLQFDMEMMARDDFKPKERINKIHDGLRDNQKLSIENANFLMDCLSLDQSFIHEVFAIIDTFKETFTDCVCGLILEKMMDLYFKIDNADYKNKIILNGHYFLSQLEFSQTNPILILGKFESVLNNHSQSDESINSILDLWVVFEPSFTVKEKSQIYLNLINSFFYCQSQVLQLRILELVTHYLILESNHHSPEIIKSLTRFSRLLINEHQKNSNFLYKFASQFYMPNLMSHVVKNKILFLLTHMILNDPASSDCLTKDFMEVLLSNAENRVDVENAIASCKDHPDQKKKALLLLTWVSLGCNSDLKEMMLDYDSLEILRMGILALALTSKVGEKSLSEDALDFGDKLLSSIHFYVEPVQSEPILRYFLVQLDQKTVDKTEIITSLKLHAKLSNRSILVENNHFSTLQKRWSQFLVEQICHQTISSEQWNEMYNLIEILAWDVDEFEHFQESMMNLNDFPDCEKLVLIFKICIQHNIDLLDILILQENVTSLSSLEKEIMTFILKNRIQEYCQIDSNFTEVDEIEETLLKKSLRTCQDAHNYQDFISFFDALMVSHDVVSPDELSDILDTMYRYREFVSLKEIFDFFQGFNRYEFSSMTEALRHFILRKVFNAKVKPRDLSELLRFFERDAFSSTQEFIPELISRLHVHDFFNLLEKTYTSHSDINPKNKKKIADFSVHGIKRWSRHFKSYLEKEHVGTGGIKLQKLIENPMILAEFFSVLRQACRLMFGYEPYHTQFFALLLMISGKKLDRGVFIQIATGEGKSLLIAMLAVFKVLCGKKVDIVTSSPILAIRDAEQFEKFYQLFNIKVENNIDKNYRGGIKKCYAADIDIVYGDINHFQYDYLRDKYSRLGTRGERPFDAIIIDEVDNLLVDEGTKIAMLSSALPAMDELHSFLLMIWLQLLNLEKMRLDPKEDFQEFKNPFRVILEKDIDDDEKQKCILDEISELLESYIDNFLLNAFRLNLQYRNRPQDEVIRLNMVYLYFYQGQAEYALKNANGQIIRTPLTDLSKDDKQKLESILKNPKRHSVIDASMMAILKQTLLKHGYHLVLETQLNIWPKHLDDFIIVQKKKWIENAKLAFYTYKETSHYDIKYNQYGVESILPVDFQNTGLIQQGTMWADGLHQFLQFKHGLKVIPENVTTNFLTNFSLIQKYKNKDTGENDLTGITGTIGSAHTQDLLNETYHGVDFYKIPTFLPNQLKRLPTYIASDFKEWIDVIVSSAISEANQGRVVLIISETIKESRKIREKILHFSDRFNGACFEYTDNLKHSDHFLNKPLKGNTIIVATNLAGRGTDIKLESGVIANGGLHVCMTFFPSGLRVELQAIGRAGRRGEPGTAQLMMNAESLRSKLPNATKEELMQISEKPDLINLLRDREEKIRIDKIRREDLNINHIKDALFEKFLVLREELEVIDKKQEESHLVFQNTNSSFFSHLNAAVQFMDFRPSKVVSQYYFNELKRCKRYAVEEKWGFWLKKVNFSQTKETIFHQFNLFSDQIKNAYHLNTIIENPVYWTRLGNRLLSYANSLAYKAYHHEFCRMALIPYDRAIELDPIFSYNALYHKIYAMVRLGEKNIKPEALNSLKDLSKILSETMTREQACFQLLMRYKTEIDEDVSDLALVYQSQAHSSQLRNRLQVFEILLQGVHLSIQQVANSMKLIDVTLHQAKGIEIQHLQLSKEEAISTIQKHALPVSLVLNNLKTHTDLWDTSQMMETIKKMTTLGSIQIEFDSSKLNMQAGRKKTLLKILPNNWDKEIEEDFHVLDQTPAEDTETIPDIQNGSQEKKLYGIQDHVAYGAGWMKKKMGKVAARVAKAVKPLGNLKERVVGHASNLQFNYSQLSDLTLSIEICVVDLTNLSDYLQPSSPCLAASYDLIVSDPNIELIQYLNSQTETFFSSIQLRIFDREKNEYENMTIRHYEFLHMNPGIRILEIRIIQCDPKAMADFIRFLQSNEAEPAMRKRLAQTVFYFRAHGLKQAQAEKFIEQCQFEMKFLFQALDPVQALSLLSLSHQHHNQLRFFLKQLQPQDAVDIITKAERGEQDLVPKHKSILDEFLKISTDQTFIQDLARNGFFYLFDVDEQNPMPWKSLIYLVGMSAIQIAGGAALAVLTAGLGSSMGFTLIAEGINDLVRVATTAYSREFSLSSHLAQKSFSLSLGFAMAGLSHAFTATKNSASLIQTVDTALELGEEVVNGAIMISSATNNTVKTAILEVFKRTGLSAVETTTMGMINSGIDHTAEIILAELRPSVVNGVTEEVGVLFGHPRWRDLFNQVFAADKIISDEEEGYFQAASLKEAQAIIEAQTFSMPSLKLTDDLGLMTFKNKFHQFLLKQKKQIDSLKSILFFCLKKKYHLKDDETSALTDKISLCLKNNKILNENGIDFHFLLREFSSLTIQPENQYQFAKEFYDIKNYALEKIKWEDELIPYRKMTIKMCLSLHVCLQDDYYYQYEQFTNKIILLFTEQMMKHIDAIADVGKRAFSTAISYGVSKGLETLDKKISNIGQDSASENTVIMQEATQAANPIEVKIEPLTQELNTGATQLPASPAQNQNAGSTIDAASPTTTPMKSDNTMQQTASPSGEIIKKGKRGFFGLRRITKKTQQAMQNLSQEAAASQVAGLAEKAGAAATDKILNTGSELLSGDKVINQLPSSASAKPSMNTLSEAEQAAKIMKDRIAQRKLELAALKKDSGVIHAKPKTPVKPGKLNSPNAKPQNTVTNRNPVTPSKPKIINQPRVMNKVQTLPVKRYQGKEFEKIALTLGGQIDHVVTKKIKNDYEAVKKEIDKHFSEKMKQLQTLQKGTQFQIKKMLKIRLAIIVLDKLTWVQLETFGKQKDHELKKIDLHQDILNPVKQLTKKCLEASSPDEQFRIVKEYLDTISNNHTRFHKELKELRKFFINIGESDMALSRQDQAVLDQQQALAVPVANLNLAGDGKFDTKEFWSKQVANWGSMGIKSVTDHLDNSQMMDLVKGKQISEGSFVSLKAISMISNCVLAACESNKAIAHDITQATIAIQNHQTQLIQSLVSLEKQKAEILQQVKESMERASKEITEKSIELELHRVQQVKDLEADCKKVRKNMDDLFEKVELSGKEDLNNLQIRQLKRYEDEVNSLQKRIENLESPESKKVLQESLQKLNEQNNDLKKYFIDAWSKGDERLSQFIQTAYESSAAITGRCIDLTEKIAAANVGMVHQVLQYCKETRDLTTWKEKKKEKLESGNQNKAVPQLEGGTTAPRQIGYQQNNIFSGSSQNPSQAQPQNTAAPASSSHTTTMNPGSY